MTRDERNALVLEYLDYVNHLLHTYAASAHLDYDDLRQDASITIMHALELKPSEASSLHTYIYASVRNRIIDKIRYNKTRQAESLDAPTEHDDQDGATLADLLPSPYQVEPLAILVTQERIRELTPMLAQRNGSRARAIRERYDTALASMEV